MKHWAIVVLFCLFAAPASAFDINAGVSGSWFNPSKDGHGFAVEFTDQPGACEQVDGQGCLVVYWFTYDKEGNPIFLLGVLPVDGNVAEGEMFYFSGQVFGSFTPTPMAESWGTLRLRFSDCDSGNVSYESDFDPGDGMPFGEGQFPISRLSFVGTLSCNKAGRLASMPDSPVAGVWSGLAISRGFVEGSNQLRSRGIAMIALDDGEAFLFMPEPAIYRGTLSGDGIDVSGQLDAFAGISRNLYNGSQTGKSQVALGGAATLGEIGDGPGEGNAGDFLQGHFNGAGIEGDLQLSFQTETSRPSTMERIGRCWLPTSTAGQTASPFRIQSGGEFSVTFNDDCKLEGTVANDLAPWNVYSASAEVTGCDAKGHYEGVATVRDQNTADDGELLMALDDGEHAFGIVGTLLSDSQCQ